MKYATISEPKLTSLAWTKFHADMDKRSADIDKLLVCNHENLSICTYPTITHCNDCGYEWRE